jgi:hypothetical protein
MKILPTEFDGQAIRRVYDEEHGNLVVFGD